LQECDLIKRNLNTMNNGQLKKQQKTTTVVYWLASALRTVMTAAFGAGKPKAKPLLPVRKLDLP